MLLLQKKIHHQTYLSKTLCHIFLNKKPIIIFIITKYNFSPKNVFTTIFLLINQLPQHLLTHKKNSAYGRQRISRAMRIVASPPKSF